MKTKTLLEKFEEAIKKPLPYEGLSTPESNDGCVSESEFRVEGLKTEPFHKERFNALLFAAGKAR